MKNLDCRQRQPDVLVIGVKKCGTGALEHFLDIHPDVEVKGRATYVMELANTEDTLGQWETFMPLTTPEQLTIAVYPELIDYPNLIAHIVRDISQKPLRFIIIIRDPVIRAISDFTHVKEVSSISKPIYPVSYRNESIGESKMKTYTVYRNYELLDTFEDTISGKDNAVVNASNILIAKGMYVNYIRKIFRIVDKNKVLIIDGDKYQKQPVDVLRQIESFLDLKPFFHQDHFQLDSSGKFYCPKVKERPDKVCLTGQDKKKGRVHPEIDEPVLVKLRSFYGQSDRSLQGLLKQTFSWME